MNMRTTPPATADSPPEVHAATPVLTERQQYIVDQTGLKESFLFFKVNAADNTMTPAERQDYERRLKTYTNKVPAVVAAKVVEKQLPIDVYHAFLKEMKPQLPDEASQEVFLKTFRKNHPTRSAQQAAEDFDRVPTSLLKYAPKPRPSKDTLTPG